MAKKKNIKRRKRRKKKTQGWPNQHHGLASDSVTLHFAKRGARPPPTFLSFFSFLLFLCVCIYIYIFSILTFWITFIFIVNDTCYTACDCWWCDTLTNSVNFSYDITFFFCLLESVYCTYPFYFLKKLTWTWIMGICDHNKYALMWSNISFFSELVWQGRENSPFLSSVFSKTINFKTL